MALNDISSEVQQFFLKLILDGHQISRVTQCITLLRIPEFYGTASAVQILQPSTLFSYQIHVFKVQSYMLTSD